LNQTKADLIAATTVTTWWIRACFARALTAGWWCRPTEGREEILRVHTRKCSSDDVDLRSSAAGTAGFSGISQPG